MEERTGLNLGAKRWGLGLGAGFEGGINVNLRKGP